MTIRFSCHKCGRAFAVKDSDASKKGKCSCGALLDIPTMSDAEIQDKLTENIVEAYQHALLSWKRLEVLQVIALLCIPVALVLAIIIPVSILRRIAIFVVSLFAFLGLAIAIRLYTDLVVIKRVGKQLKAINVSPQSAVRILIERPEFDQSRKSWDIVIDLFPLAGHFLKARRCILREKDKPACNIIFRWREVLSDSTESGEQYAPIRLEALAWVAMAYLTLAYEQKNYI